MRVGISETKEHIQYLNEGGSSHQTPLRLSNQLHMSTLISTLSSAHIYSGVYGIMNVENQANLHTMIEIERLIGCLKFRQLHDVAVIT